MEANTTVKMVQRTWLGQRGESGEIALDSKRNGKRIAVLRWLEDGKQGQEGEVSIRLVEGDAWRDPENFREFSSETLHDPIDAELDAAIQRAQGLAGPVSH